MVGMASLALGAFLTAGSVQAVAEGAAGAASPEAPRAAWVQALLASRADLESAPLTVAERAERQRRLERQWQREFPVEFHWWLQDLGPDRSGAGAAEPLATQVRQATAVVLAELAGDAGALAVTFDRLSHAAPAVDDRRWLELYVSACDQRRRRRLASLEARFPRLVFTQHYNLGGSHYAYTEGQSDAQHERHFEPGSALCLLELEGGVARVRTLLRDPGGVIRDPDVSWDGERVLFAWKTSDRGDDYHLYELDSSSGRVRQLTSGSGVADYEGAYLPNGDIVFASTRCVQTVDCWWTEVSNLYTCDPDGRFLRRLTFDQVHDNYPTVLPDGRVVYTRWEYNDRGQIYVQGLFQMHPDGTGQTEFYGNNSWFPTALLHARGIPGTTKLVAIFSGHHTRQAGKLGLVDPARGRQENSGAQLIAPVRPTPAVRVDAYGQEGELFQYPYPLSETEFIVAAAPLGWTGHETRFSLFWIAADGRRELLAADPEVSCNQPVPLAPRARPGLRPSLVNYRQSQGTVYVQDVYAGPGLAGVTRGTIRRLRVVALDFRAAGIGQNYNRGPAGSALASTPVAIGDGCWDVKIVLGDAPVYPDGSACFSVPARTPFYFQALDERGSAVQTMRSWATLQPGEHASCVGCHEPKNSTPPATARFTRALEVGPRPLEPAGGTPRGFSFHREIQPILDRHCVECHPGPESPLDLRDTPVVEAIAKRRWSQSYLALVHAQAAELGGERYWAGTPNDLVNWISPQSAPPILPPYAAGSTQSRLLALLTAGHYDCRLTPGDLETIACWIDLLVPFCGDYTEAHAWTAQETALYDRFLRKRRTWEELERQQIEALLAQPFLAPESL